MTMIPKIPTFSALLVLVFAALSARDVRAESHTTCKDPSVTWYNNADGLNPCQQYEALRRLCDASYEVPVMSVNTPGDACDSQLHDCCCNSVAFALSMLCLNCQQGVGTGKKGDNGIDAGVPAYNWYLAGCGAGTNQSLPTNTQLAVCHTGLNLKKYLYDLFWRDGDWFLEFTRQTANLDAATGQDDSGKCPATTTSVPLTTVSAPTSTVSRSSSTPVTTSQSQPAPDAQNQNETGGASPTGGADHTAAIVGGTLGGAVVLVLLIAGIFYLIRRRQRSSAPTYHPPHPIMYEQRPHTAYSGNGTLETGTSVGPFYVGRASGVTSSVPTSRPSDVGQLSYARQSDSDYLRHSVRPPSSQLPGYEYATRQYSSHDGLLANGSALDLAPHEPVPPVPVPVFSGGPATGDVKGRRDGPRGPPIL